MPKQKNNKKINQKIEKLTHLLDKSIFLYWDAYDVTVGGLGNLSEKQLDMMIRMLESAHEKQDEFLAQLLTNNPNFNKDFDKFGAKHITKSKLTGLENWFKS